VFAGRLRLVLAGSGKDTVHAPLSVVVFLVALFVVFTDTSAN